MASHWSASYHYMPKQRVGSLLYDDVEIVEHICFTVGWIEPENKT